MAADGQTAVVAADAGKWASCEMLSARKSPSLALGWCWEASPRVSDAQLQYGTIKNLIEISRILKETGEEIEAK